MERFTSRFEKSVNTFGNLLLVPNKPKWQGVIFVLHITKSIVFVHTDKTENVGYFKRSCNKINP